MQELKRYPVDWDGRPRVLSVPRDNIGAEIKMTDLASLADPWRAIQYALEHPIGRPPLHEMLRPGQTVALMTGDRFTDQMLGARDGLGMKLLDYLNHLGVRDEDVTLVYAPGSHPSPHWRKLLGDRLLARVRCIRHDCFDEGALVYLGATTSGTPVWVNRAVAEADLRLGIGEVSPNLQGGWCGGGKMILPGVAGWNTIEQNHAGVLTPINTLGLADGNPMRRDMEEASAMAHLDMKLDLLIDSASRIVAAYAGDPVQEHRTALIKARRIWMTRMEPADIYVLYPGVGSERYLESSFFIKIEGAELGTRPEGIIIMALSAAGGWSPSQTSGHAHWMPPTETAAYFKGGTEAIARGIVRREANVRTLSCLYTARRVLERRRTFLVCDGISPQDALDLGFAHCTTSFGEALTMALGERGQAARIAVNVVDNRFDAYAGRPVSWRAMPWRQG
ncbi:MAG: DUF2088 domain-containing protein [Anaerolineae bacterium]|nr:DUF2088 domain-containing protein [Anaerolineae bacterium]